jgi:quercetin dioxygenase-like cupin family protein
MEQKEHARKKRMAVFYSADAGELPDEMMPREGFDDSVMAGLARLAEAGVTEGLGERNRVLFREPGEEGMSLVHVWFKSGYVLPFHSHSTDCLYYVLGGELRMGSRILRKGDGMFIPADHGYGYEAGPEGVELLEFRNATHFNLFFRANPPERWEQIAEVYTHRAATWAEETEPPSERREMK